MQQSVSSPGNAVREPRALRPAIFLDRDGTLIQERNYLADPELVELIPGAAQALRALAEAGYALVLVTNQSGIARGYIRPEEYQAVQDRLHALLAAEGVRLDGVYCCPHHPEITGPCECRKPAPGLFRQAAAELRLDLRASYYVGDRLRDVLPARVLGGTGILVRTGYGAQEADAAPDDVLVIPDLAALPGYIIHGSGPARP
ncbi:MAG TPA: HAD-IIIA family hydrolase [Longimicrobiales bacterium]